jgi:hypothetical protein
MKKLLLLVVAGLAIIGIANSGSNSTPGGPDAQPTGSAAVYQRIAVENGLRRAPSRVRPV